MSTNGKAAATNGAATNGAPRHQTDKVRVAIIGVGNCASAFVPVSYTHLTLPTIYSV